MSQSKEANARVRNIDKMNDNKSHCMEFVDKKVYT